MITPNKRSAIRGKTTHHQTAVLRRSTTMLICYGYSVKLQRSYGEVGRFLIPRVALRLLGVIHVYLLRRFFYVHLRDVKLLTCKGFKRFLTPISSYVMQRSGMRNPEGLDAVNLFPNHNNLFIFHSLVSVFRWQLFILNF